VDTVELDQVRKDAGAVYLEALERLGLHPSALFWAKDKVTNGFVLVLATEMFDYKGPLALSKLLFKAYNAAATPQEIDPFVVRLHSPDHAIIRMLDGWRNLSNLKITHKNGVPIDPSVSIQGVTVDDLEFRPDWVYLYNLPPKKGSIELLRRWRRFQAAVNKLAA
jgi:hypothetical protein